MMHDSELSFGRRTTVQHLPKGSSDVSTANGAEVRNGGRAGCKAWRYVFIQSIATLCTLLDSVAHRSYALAFLRSIASRNILPVSNRTTLLSHDYVYQIAGIRLPTPQHLI
jgi:hypothetical protein